MTQTPVRLGVIGAGGFFQMRASRFLDAGARIVAVAEPSAPMRDRLQQTLPTGDAPVFYDDHRAMVESTALDGVVVASPHGLHSQHIADALASGAHALVYKPMVTTSADARRLVELAGESGLTVSI